MVNRPLPVALRKRIIKAFENKTVKQKDTVSPKRLFFRLRNVDYRRRLAGAKNNSKKRRELGPDFVKQFDFIKEVWGERIRAMNVKRNYPKLGKIVFKRVHGMSAGELVTHLNRLVNFVNASPKRKRNDWVVVKPFIYPINEDVVAMAHINIPALGEMLAPLDSHTGTHRGQNALLSFLKLNPKYSAQDLFEISDDIKRSGFGNTNTNNFVFLGIKKGKFVFVPLADAY